MQWWRDLLLWNGCNFVWATYHTWKKTVLHESHLQCHAGCFLLTQIVLMRVFHSKINLESNNVCWTRGWSANYVQALLKEEGCSDLKLCNTKVHCETTQLLYSCMSLAVHRECNVGTVTMEISHLWQKNLAQLQLSKHVCLFCKPQIYI